LNFYLQLSLLVGIDAGCSPLSLLMPALVLWSGSGTVLRHMFLSEGFFYYCFCFARKKRLFFTDFLGFSFYIFGAAF
jgi:hypothetical protein